MIQEDLNNVNYCRTGMIGIDAVFNAAFDSAFLLETKKSNGYNKKI